MSRFRPPARRGPVLLMLLLTGLLSACAPRGTIQIDPDSGEVGRVKQLLVASTRAPVDSSAVLSGARSDRLSFFDFRVSVPPDRLPGTVSFASTPPPDPERHFATVSAVRLSGLPSFQRHINQALVTDSPDKKEVAVFVHGFNSTFAEALYRQAQLGHDFDSKTVGVNFAWASAGSVRSYAFDRESALLARDALEQVLGAIHRTQAQRIVLIAHSMGAQLTMETLRQMAIRDRPGAFSRIASIVLVAPDVDVDLFRRQARSIGQYDIPIYVFVSSRDRALRFSSFLRGSRRGPRLGAISDASVLGDVPVAVIDKTDLDANSDPLQHFKAATSPTMIALFSGRGTEGLTMFAQGDNRPTLLQGGAEIFQNTASTVFGGG